MHSYRSILRIVLHGRSAGKILLATVLSFTFSISVILCTFGLMDGFDHLLKSGLRNASGDLLITNRKGFFSLSEELRDHIQGVAPLAVAQVIQTEAFAMAGEESRGVLVRGIDDESFARATGLELAIPPGGVVIGEELARQLRLKVGDPMALTFGKGNESLDSLPLIQPVTVHSVVKHGIYQKDLRYIYLPRTDVAALLDLGDRVNLIIVTSRDPSKPLDSLDSIRDDQDLLRRNLDSSYLVRPFWNEYDFLLEAVKVEKFSISLILQLIVVVAIFNIIAFVIYIMEKKSQEFFFLRAVGLSLSALNRFWFVSVIAMWSVSCIGAYFISLAFNWALKHVSFLQIPGEIYVLSSLDLKLDRMAYITVYGVSLLWILFAAFIGFLRLKRRPIIQGLRQEFSS